MYRLTGTTRRISYARRQLPCDRSWWTEPEPNSLRSGGENCRVECHDFFDPLPDAELLHLDEALTRLAVLKPEHAKLVELRYFAGMSNEEAAASLEVSQATGTRMMNYAKAWLKVEMERG